jgi:hypothetical protein
VELHPNQSQDIIAYLGRGSSDRTPSDWSKNRKPIDPNVDLCAVRDSGNDELINENTFHFQVNLIYRNPNDPNAEPFYLHTTPFTGCLVSRMMDSILRDDDPRVVHKDARVSLTKDIIPFLLSLLQGLDISGLPTALLNPDLVRPVLDQILGVDPFAFDFGPFFHDPVSPRDLLPAWDTPGMVSEPEKQLLWMELECLYDTSQDAIASTRSVTMQTVATTQPYRLIDRLFCREDGTKNIVLQKCDTAGTLTRCDLSHFPAHNTTNSSYPGIPGDLDGLVNTFGISQIPPDRIVGSDGNASDFPYIAFRNPSFNRLLWLDLYSLNLGGGSTPEFPGALRLDNNPGFEPARLDTLNAAIAIISKRIGALLSLIE